MNFQFFVNCNLLDTKQNYWNKRKNVSLRSILLVISSAVPFFGGHECFGEWLLRITLYYYVTIEISLIKANTMMSQLIVFGLLWWFGTLILFNSLWLLGELELQESWTHWMFLGWLYFIWWYFQHATFMINTCRKELKEGS